MFKKMLLAAMLILPASIFAQTLKFGHIQSQEILAAMPEIAKAQTEMQAMQKKYMDEIQKTNEEFQKKYQEFLKEKDTLPANISERRQKELEDMARRSEEFQQNADQAVSKAQNELMAPIYQKLDEAIKAVGQSEGVVYIFDLSRTPIPYVNTAQSTDVTPLVKTKLGIK